MLLLTGLEIYIYTPIPGPAPLNKKIVGFTWRGVLDPFMPRRDHAAASRNPQSAMEVAEMPRSAYGLACGLAQCMYVPAPGAFAVPGQATTACAGGTVE